jgi:hypothetical protein
MLVLIFFSLLKTPLWDAGEPSSPHSSLFVSPTSQVRFTLLFLVLFSLFLFCLFTSFFYFHHPAFIVTTEISLFFICLTDIPGVRLAHTGHEPSFPLKPISYSKESVAGNEHPQFFLLA